MEVYEVFYTVDSGYFSGAKMSVKVLADTPAGAIYKADMGLRSIQEIKGKFTQQSIKHITSVDLL